MLLSNDGESRHQFIAAIGNGTFDPGSPVRHHLESLLNAEGIYYQDLEGASVALLRKVPEISVLIAAATESPIGNPDLLRALDDPLLHKVLRLTVVTDLALERLLTDARSCFLRQALADCMALTDQLRLMASLACQCFNNEYIYPTTQAEEASLDVLRTRISGAVAAGDRARLLPRMAVYGMYRPLYGLEEAPALLALGAEPGGELGVESGGEIGEIDEVIRRQIAEPVEEMRLKGTIPSFGLDTDQVSRNVRQQYEDFPYPRWFNFPRGTQTRFSDSAAGKFPFLHVPDLPHPTILIAGCGTGHHPLSVAFSHPESSVVAIDFSLTSLACAKRHAERYKISNVEFLHGNLLSVSQLKRTFDSIEAAGVLHHMDDPVAGMKALIAVLKPGGFLKVGLYSRRVMAPLREAQCLFDSILGGDRSPAKLRQARQAVIGTIGIAPINCLEFFHLNGLPDIFSPAHAKHFAPTELHSLFGELDVDFLGYRVREAVLADYRLRFPHDLYLQDLHSVDLFEQEFPALFDGLQMFYLRKKFA